MNSFENLLERLDAAPIENWEAEYAAVSVDMTRSDAVTIVESDWPYAEWFMFRFDAGPPGTPMLPWGEAMTAVMNTTGSPLEAYRSIFTAVLPDDAPEELICGLLCNAAGCALKGGTTWLSSWLSTRAALAAIALGKPEQAWKFLDLFPEDNVHLQFLRVFEPIRGDFGLERHVWVRATIRYIWPGCRVPAIPRLPAVKVDPEHIVELEGLLKRLSGLGAEQLCALVLATYRALVDTPDENETARELQTRATILRSNADSSALDLLQAALRKVPCDSVSWVLIATDVVAATMQFGTAGDAAQKGLSLLNEAMCGPTGELGMLHVLVGEACSRAERLEDARTQLEAGLLMLQGAHSRESTLARLYLANLGLRLQEHALIDHHLRSLELIYSDLTPDLRHDYQLIRSEFAAMQGSRDEQVRALEAALTHAPNSETEVIDRLRLAQVDLLAGLQISGLMDLVEEATRMPESPVLSKLLVDIVCNYDLVWPPLLSEQLINWADAMSRPSVVARLRYVAGEVVQARVVLATALSGELTTEEELACRSIQLAVAETASERRQICHDLEKLLEAIDAPEVRVGIAIALHQDAPDDSDVLHQALLHARLAFRASCNARIRARAFRIGVGITLALVRNQLPVSSSRQAEVVRRLVEGEYLPEVPKTLGAIVHALLLPGPITHDSALEAARTLLDWSVIAVAGEGALRSRLAWIEDWSGPPIDAAEYHRGPFDEMPIWLVKLVRKEETSLAGVCLSGEIDVLSAALQCRPDRADRVLAAILPLHSGLSLLELEALLAVIQHVVASTSALAETWPELGRAQELLHHTEPSPFTSDVAAALERARLPQNKRQVSIESGPLDAPEARARKCFDEAVRLLGAHQLDPNADKAKGRIEKARILLEEAVNIATTQRRPELFDFLVSLGNAWKMCPGEDIERALSVYDRAEKLNVVLEQSAKLWKVRADALRQRGRPADLRDAALLLERSLKFRHGCVRAETLLSAAQVALQYPDRSPLERQVQAAQYLLASVRADPVHAEQWIDFTLKVLGEWRVLKPADPRLDEMVAALKIAYPKRAAEIDSPVPRLSELEVKCIMVVLTHPAGRAFQEIQARIAPVAGALRDDFELVRPAHMAIIEEQLERESLFNRPDEVENFLETLDLPNDLSAPGVLAGRVLLLAQLTRWDRGEVAEVYSATNRAITSAELVEDVIMRSTLLRELALVWSPDDHADDPVQDFDLAAELLTQCVRLEGGEQAALTDTLGALARARRYARIGDHRASLREARRLYGLAVERPALPADVRANLLHNLAEVEAYLSVGTLSQRFFNQERKLELALATAKSAEQKAEMLATLGWVRTQIGNSADVDRENALQRAKSTFGEVDSSLLSPTKLRSFEANRDVCDASLVRATGGRLAEIAFWRRRVADLDPASYRIGTAQHNLANALFNDDMELSPAELAEGLQLSREAAELRTLDVNARHNWETTFNAGRALVRMIRSGRSGFLPKTKLDAFAEAESWLTTSIVAAESLGYGEELTLSALALFELAINLESPAAMSKLMEQAWSYLARAAGYLVFDVDSREKEARFAMQGAANLAYKLAEDGVVSGSADLAFVLQGERAALVARWIGRAHEPAQRPLRARLSRPDTVSAGRWVEWQEALASEDPMAIARSLERIHSVAPSFLTEGGPAETTWHWLEAYEGSIAISLTVAHPLSLVLLMQIDTAGRKQLWVLGLEVPEPAAVEEHSVQANWLKTHVVDHVDRFLGQSPTAVLWNPGPVVRRIAPAVLWPGVPVAITAALELPDLTKAPTRRRSTLLFLADPGQSSGQFEELSDYGLEGVLTLTNTARSVGPARVIASQGSRYGRMLLGSAEGIRDTPASVRDLLEEVAEHDTVVLLAHGEVESLEKAAIICIGADGKPDRLNIHAMEQHPTSFTGATFILLACESGRVGDSLAKPGGLAGTLIAAGARCVVAPLWPIKVDVAVKVGEAVLAGMARGEQPWETLAVLQIPNTSKSPSLGPPSSPAEREESSAMQNLAFVTWVG